MLSLCDPKCVLEISRSSFLSVQYKIQELHLLYFTGFTRRFDGHYKLGTITSQGIGLGTY